ncbi:MAG: 2-C-methyl-D-erythritol 2,4-cyclodiphosphate synthase [Bacilli bacterium]|nr:2-C-methyl-D-erythritol 2,4-cyclodiphosphate synthase [Bacilli bacterium]
MIRIGFAKDIHKLVAKRKLMLAGIHIPFPKGEQAHSDGDVIIHAVSEALLGALALGDLGTHFPDTDSAYKNMAGKIILSRVYTLIKKKGYYIQNIDISVELEKPKLAKYINKMRQSLADILKIKLSQVSIKASTNEGLGEVGHAQAVIANAIVLLKSEK